MEKNYEENARLLKVIADPSRLQILDLLSCGELCAGEILENFEFTQPTLSHHMKILADAGLANVRKAGIWTYYSLADGKCEQVLGMLAGVFQPSADCICKVIDEKQPHSILIGEKK